MTRTMCCFSLMLAVMWYPLRNAGGEEPDFLNSLDMTFVLLPAGKFVMGTSPGEWGRGRNEGPQREVTITHPFYMCQYETINKWFKQFVAETKYTPQGDNESDSQFLLYLKIEPRPGRTEYMDNYAVAFVSWYATIRFCNWLSEKEGKTPVYTFDEKEKEGEYALPVVHMKNPYDGGYRLPTEAEWEYAARSGTSTAFFFGDDDTDIRKFAYISRYGGGAMPEPVLPPPQLPNAWGLYHMCGNVGEWCWDRYSPNYEFYETVDPTGPHRGIYRVSRDGGGGGKLGIATVYSRSGARMPDFPTVTRYDLGFRVVFVKTEKTKPAAAAPPKR